MVPAPTTLILRSTAMLTTRAVAEPGARHGFGIKQFRQLVIAERRALARDLANRPAAGVRLLGDRCGGVIPDARCERSCDHQSALHEIWTVAGGDDTIDRLQRQGARTRP